MHKYNKNWQTILASTPRMTTYPKFEKTRGLEGDSIRSSPITDEFKSSENFLNISDEMDGIIHAVLINFGSKILPNKNNFRILNGIHYFEMEKTR